MRECLQQVEGPSQALLNARLDCGENVRGVSTESGQGYSALTHEAASVALPCGWREMATVVSSQLDSMARMVVGMDGR